MREKALTTGAGVLPPPPPMRERTNTNMVNVSASKDISGGKYGCAE